jgi:hypothetical protein
MKKSRLLVWGAFINTAFFIPSGGPPTAFHPISFKMIIEINRII